MLMNEIDPKVTLKDFGDSAIQLVIESLRWFVFASIPWFLNISGIYFLVVDAWFPTAPSNFGPLLPFLSVGLYFLTMIYAYSKLRARLKEREEQLAEFQSVVLDIIFEDNPHYIENMKRTPMKVYDYVGNRLTQRVEIDFWIVKVRVICSGNKTVENARLELADISPKPREFVVPTGLHLVHSEQPGTSESTLLPGGELFFDVAQSIIGNDGTKSLEIYHVVPSNVMNREIPIDRYKLTLAAYGANARPCRKEFTLRIDDKTGKLTLQSV
jgi:hypothetical protein